MVEQRQYQKIASHVLADSAQSSRLHKCSFTLQNVQCIFETCNLSLPSALAFSITLHLVGAFLIKLSTIIVGSLQFSRDQFPVRAEVRDSLVKANRLLLLVLNILQF